MFAKVLRSKKRWSARLVTLKKRVCTPTSSFGGLKLSRKGGSARDVVFPPLVERVGWRQALHKYPAVPDPERSWVSKSFQPGVEEEKRGTRNRKCWRLRDFSCNRSGFALPTMISKTRLARIVFRVWGLAAAFSERFYFALSEEREAFFFSHCLPWPPSSQRGRKPPYYRLGWTEGR